MTTPSDRARRELLRRDRALRPARIVVPEPNPDADEEFLRLLDAIRPARPT